MFPVVNDWEILIPFVGKWMKTRHVWKHQAGLVTHCWGCLTTPAAIPWRSWDSSGLWESGHCMAPQMLLLSQTNPLHFDLVFQNGIGYDMAWLSGKIVVLGEQRSHKKTNRMPHVLNPPNSNSRDSAADCNPNGTMNKIHQNPTLLQLCSV